MSHRFFVSLGLFALAIVLAAPSPSQTPAKWVQPKTLWGDPDLQGVWPGNVGVPMQRPQNMGERTLLTDEEFAQRLAQSKRQAEEDSQVFAASDTRPGIGPPSYWTERGRPTRQTSLIVDPPNGRLPALTPEAEKHRLEARAGQGLPGEWRGVADSYEDLNIYYRCITRGLLGSIIPVVYNNGNQIIQAPGYVVFRNEMIHEARIIPLDKRPHVNSKIRMYMGDSRGYWEGNTLVVETMNFPADKVAIGSNGAGYPGDPGYHSEELKIVERFTRVSDDKIEYRATVIDPKTWTRPWTMLIELEKDDEYQYFEYACHEGNYAMEDILSGARAVEKQ